MDVKQKAALYGSMGILLIAGLIFLIKGVPDGNISLIIIGILLIIMGIGRWVLIHRLLFEHEDI